VAIESNGVIRDNLLRGKTGMISVADLFRTIPLGIGVDGTIGYPLVLFTSMAMKLKEHWKY